MEFTRNRYLTLVRNDRLADLVADLPYVVLYEIIWQLSQLIRSPRRLAAHWLGLAQVVKSLPRARRARKQIQQRRTVSRAYIRRFFDSQLW